jgi:hypothetical protein
MQTNLQDLNPAPVTSLDTSLCHVTPSTTPQASQEKMVMGTVLWFSDEIPVITFLQPGQVGGFMVPFTDSNSFQFTIKF